MQFLGILVRCHPPNRRHDSNRGNSFLDDGESVSREVETRNVRANFSMADELDTIPGRANSAAIEPPGTTLMLAAGFLALRVAGELLFRP